MIEIILNIIMITALSYMLIAFAFTLYLEHKYDIWMPIVFGTIWPLILLKVYREYRENNAGYTDR